MLTLAYSIDLPDDYDMSIIDRRIAAGGPVTDTLPGLLFKAYLTRRSDDQATPRYAPFYVWHNEEAARDFLTGPGFARLCRDFGRPQVATTLVVQCRLNEGWQDARFARLERLPITADSDLESLAERESEVAEAQTGALAVVAGVATGPWEMVRLSLWKEKPATGHGSGDVYRVGYVSRPHSKGSSSP